MARQPEKSEASLILLDEYFAASNDAFLTELRYCTNPRALAGLADRWKIDPRPWARQKIFDYLDQPLATAGHNVLVKRLFKHAEKQRDSELLAAFLHAFDVLVRRARNMKWRWDPTIRQATQEEILESPRNSLLPAGTMQVRNPKTGAMITINKGGRVPKNGRLFSYRTRYYLRRRVWRYFRFLGFHTPPQLPGAIAPALARYTDDDLATGEHILDSWCLLNIAFRHHPALAFTPSHVRLNEGHSLNDLTPAPKLLKAWQTAEGAAALWSLLPLAQSRFVRLWAIAMLKQHHAAFLEALALDALLPLFDRFDEELAQFATELFEKNAALPTLPITTWLRLLNTQNPTALAAVTTLMQRHVTADRLSLDQTVALAISAPAPIATLGLTFLRTRPFNTPQDRQSLSDLAPAKSAAVAPALTAFALSILGMPQHYDVTLVSRFFDALIPPTRTAAWSWLTPDSPGYADPALWSRLLETPYEDVRLQLVKRLEARASLPGATLDTLAPIWTAVLLGIHRGGRHKILALHQISRALGEHPAAAEKLLPVIALAIRSIRPPEARVGLAAIVAAVEKNPALSASASAAVPELRFISAGATA